MKKLLIAIVLSCISSSAFALCGAIPLPILDGTGTSRNMSSATAADGNCKTYIDSDTSSQIHQDLTSPVPLGTTSGGWTTHQDDALSNTAIAIKASAGWLGKLYCYNPNASAVFIQVYNVAAGSVTVGTTTHAQSYGMPPTQANGFIMPVQGDQYSTAISYAATTAVANGTAPGSAVTCTVSFN